MQVHRVDQTLLPPSCIASLACVCMMAACPLRLNGRPQKEMKIEVLRLFRGSTHTHTPASGVFFRKRPECASKRSYTGAAHEGVSAGKPLETPDRRSQSPKGAVLRTCSSGRGNQWRGCGEEESGQVRGRYANKENHLKHPTEDHSHPKVPC